TPEAVVRAVQVLCARQLPPSAHQATHVPASGYPPPRQVSPSAHKAATFVLASQRSSSFPGPDARQENVRPSVVSHVSPVGQANEAPQLRGPAPAAAPVLAISRTPECPHALVATTSARYRRERPPHVLLLDDKGCR